MHHTFARLRRCALLFAVLAVSCPLAAATTPGEPPRTPVVPAPARTWEFAEDGVVFDSQFPAARLSECTRLGSGSYAVVSEPENRPINPSPWFAFRVRAERPRLLTIRINTATARLRYVPKVSVDGRRWITLPAEAFVRGEREDEGTIRVDAGPEPLWIAAQEIVSGEDLEAWGRSLESLPFVARREIGRSVGGRALHALDIDATAPGAASGCVVIVGRQHPPEVTGSLALMRFVETVVAETPLARRFRARFAVLLVPLLNPDGVAGGHWRHNLNGVDTNRDWARFDQPETRAVRDAVLAVRASRRPVLHLDFHSTFSDVFYTQTDEQPMQPAGFTKAWLEGVGTRVPSYAIKRTPNANPTQATSHHWAHREFGIPAITYELGDNTDRALLQTVASAAAESMMEQLLALVPETPAR